MFQVKTVNGSWEGLPGSDSDPNGSGAVPPRGEGAQNKRLSGPGTITGAPWGHVSVIW